MPTIDRKSRTRLRSRGESDIQGVEDMRRVLADAHGDDEKWREARPRVVRFPAQRVKDASRALRIAEVFHRSPHLMPMRPPTSS